MEASLVLQSVKSVCIHYFSHYRRNGLQTAIAKQIIKQEGDYILNLKGNQKLLHNDVNLFITSYVDNNTNSEVEFSYFMTMTSDHGRIENRLYWMTDNIDCL